MSRFFNFRTSFSLPGDIHDREVLVLSQGFQHFEADDLTATLESTLEHDALPDDIFIIVPISSFDEVIKQCRCDASLKTALQRGPTIWARVLIGINGYGLVGKVEFLGGIQPLTEPQIDDVFKRVIQEGLHHIALNHNVLKRAPAGCVFVKPSGDVLDIFLLAADLLQSEPEIVFVGIAVLQKIGLQLDGVRTIYIDTMSMQPLARAVIGLAQNAGRHVAPAIQSFHSYTGIEELRSEMPERMLCLISASTSGALAKRFAAHTRCTGNRIVTCLDVENHRDDSHILINAQTLFNVDIRGRDKGRLGAARVQLAGEFFSSTASPPRAVVLSLKHAVPDLKQKISLFGVQKIFTLDLAASGADQPRALAVDGAALMLVDPFKDWVIQRLRWSVPGATKWIIHADDPVSESMASFCEHQIEKMGLPKPEGLIKASDLGGKTPMSTDHGVLIVSAVVRSGTQLASISRDLRLFAPKSPRTFLIGAALPISNYAYRTTEANLRKGPKSWGYSVETWFSMAAGHSDGMSSWDEERVLLLHLLEEQADPSFITWVEKRFKDISDTGTVGSSNRLHSTTSGAPLVLRRDFVFLDNAQELADQALVYAVISATLQNARENTSIAIDLQLKSNAYGHVVLSPECFTRYNDGVIQASLLRAAYPSELDFEYSPELSAEMSRILRRVFQHHRLERGEAAIEFATVLATQRMRIAKTWGRRLLSDELLALVKDVPELYGLLDFARHRYYYDESR